MNGLTIAMSIVAGNSAAVALLVYGLVCGCPWGMNLCWVAAIWLLYASIDFAMARGRSIVAEPAMISGAAASSPNSPSKLEPEACYQTHDAESTDGAVASRTEDAHGGGAEVV